MIQIGSIGNFNNYYGDEVQFAKNNGFELLQLWYDKDGLKMLKDRNPIEVILEEKFPCIIHALLDINEFDEHTNKLLDILNELEHREVIIHPICRSEAIDDQTIFKLSNCIKKASALFKSNDIKLFIENNSRLDPILCTAKELNIVFSDNPDVEFLLDLAHIDHYEHLLEMITVKAPKMLHIADRRFEIIHEHLPIGDGEIDFDLIFKSYLNNFTGKIILEVLGSYETITSSRDKINGSLKPC